MSRRPPKVGIRNAEITQSLDQALTTRYDSFDTGSNVTTAFESHAIHDNACQALLKATVIATSPSLALDSRLTIFRSDDRPGPLDPRSDGSPGSGRL
ncbi:MAG: hypothetical protein JWM11_2757 [Planctomycetaceae bacterium]|nr:hypothetical protein [Planctomycetaceae bacterium]